MTRSRFGRSKFGGPPAALISGSIIAGLAISFVAALIVWAIVRPEESAALYLGIFTLCLFPVASAGAWAALVDRDTIAGATPNPQDSIESTWYDNASQTTFHIILVIVGILGVASVFTDVKLSLGTFAIASYVVIMAAFAGSYLLNKRRDS
ncbi:hypothetical protein [Corynebacterium sp. J010B-136]|uniref:hypothetical protein n=1 Tax=Corynebacterium sp. J010B-136 TaxID=2099401 RepID=UPI000CF9C241|nr:hypothetical protein [Corynebacterium sp. J010B-136]PQM74172.1 hypothetical protein C5Y44_07540 [Corynebacterium sp. J010B-136]